jgi:hypothetical protein
MFSRVLIEMTHDISGSHGGKHEGDCLLGRCDV